MGFRRVLGICVAAAAGVVGLPTAVAVAAPPNPSDVVVSSTTVAQGGLLTVSVELFNPQNFTVTSANASLRLPDSSIVDVLNLDSCTGSVAGCGAYLSSYRGSVGDLAPGQSKVVVFTFHVKDTAEPGVYALEHQLTGGNYAFEAVIGPSLTITGEPQAADVAVALSASPPGILTSRVTFTVSVANSGPAAASGVVISGTYPSAFSWGSGSGCVRVGTSRNVRCEFATLPVGGTASARFTVNANLLALGSFSTSVARSASSPSDPNSHNDSARWSCTAVTGLLVRC
jgi:uncharacterized repeat protein (TIGR01451 family)